MDIPKEFGKDLKKLRIDKGISQEAFALCCGIDRTFMSKMERGLRQPSLVSILKLAKGFSLKPSELMAITLDKLYDEKHTENKPREKTEKKGT